MKLLKSILLLCFAVTLTQCSSDSNSDGSQDDDGSGGGANNIPTLSASLSQIAFEDTTANEYSSVKTINLSFTNLTSDINITSTSVFELSLDGVSFSNNIIMPFDNISTNIFTRFAPDSINDFQGEITVQNADITDDIIISVNGSGISRIFNYKTFDKTRVAFGGGYSQTSVQSFNLHDDLTNIEAIKMYVQLTCDSVDGCDEWDVFANVKVTDPISGERYEMARFITPYWNDSSQLARGFEFDVTDFKSMLTGDNIELRIRTECWNARGYEVSIDFDYIEGTPDYQYYGITRLLNYDNGSAAGIPYGIPHSLDLTRSINVPSNAQSTHLRTIISGWGQAVSGDSDGRTCAEWCFRTHDVKVNGTNMFQHDLAPLGCASNPLSNQDPGNWRPDRAGWCPGMEVPTRIDQLTSSMAGSTFTFEYDLEDWTNNTNDDSYYPISSFVVVKSDTPITRALVTD